MDKYWEVVFKDSEVVTVKAVDEESARYAAKKVVSNADKDRTNFNIKSVKEVKAKPVEMMNMLNYQRGIFSNSDHNLAQVPFLNLNMAVQSMNVAFLMLAAQKGTSIDGVILTIRTALKENAIKMRADAKQQLATVFKDLTLFATELGLTLDELAQISLGKGILPNQ